MLSANTEKQNRKARLLCVDDDLHFLLLFTAVLEGAGYSVVAANDPRKALELAAKTGFDLVILDYDMPHMNGAELACRLKERRSDLPIVLFSGHPSPPADALSIVDEHAVKGEGPELLMQILSGRVCRLDPLSGNTRNSSAVAVHGVSSTLNHKPRIKKRHTRGSIEAAPNYHRNTSVNTIVQ